MAVGRYLATDIGPKISGFGDAIAGLTGQVLDIQQMAEARADRERMRRLEESREERLRKQFDMDQARDLYETASELSEMDPDRRRLVAGTLSPSKRKKLGFAEAIPASSMDVQPPMGVPGIEPGATTIETPSRPMVDPYGAMGGEGVDDNAIVYRQREFETPDDYLDFRTEEERAKYAGRPDRATGGGSSRPRSADVRAVLDPLTEDPQTGLPLIPGEDRSRLYAKGVEGDIPLGVLPDSVAAVKRREEARRAAEAPEEEGPAWWERAGAAIGDFFSGNEGDPSRGRLSGPADGDGEDGTVRMPWPRPDEFRDRAPEGMRGPDVETGTLSTEADELVRQISEEDAAAIQQALERGMSPEEVASAISVDTEVDESTAMEVVQYYGGE